MKIWDEQAYRDAYGYFDQTTQTRVFTYNRQNFVDVSNFGYIRTTVTELIRRNMFSMGTEYLLAGCGFNWWGEFLISLGVPEGNVFGIEPSEYIQQNKATQSLYPEKILDYDLSDPNILNLLKPHFGGSGAVNGWVLSTLVLTSLQTDQEIDQFAADLDGVVANNGQVGHIFTSAGNNGASDMNWQPREYWSDRLGATHWLFDIQNGFKVWDPAVGIWQ